VTILNKQSWKANKGWSANLGVGQGAYNAMKHFTRRWNWVGHVAHMGD
jgi:hypothetical protein